MALSNIGKEPRREITESAVGLLIFIGLFVIPGILFALHFGPEWADENCEQTCSIIFTGILLWPIIFGGSITIGAAILFGTHFIGESVCDALERIGIQLRPRQRCR